MLSKLRQYKSLVFSSLLVFSGICHAAWPERLITVVVPYAAGGSTDVVGRLIAKGLSDQLGVTVIVENRPGASGNIGAKQVAAAKPDGYTLMVATTAHSINMATFKEPGYDFVADFTAISMINEGPLLLVTRRDLPVNNVAELIQLAKSTPGQLTYATPGNGTSPHLAAEIFSQAAGIKMVNIPYVGSAPALNDLVAGHVDMSFDLILSALPFVENGRIKAIAATSKTRTPAAAAWPTIAEQGGPGLAQFHEMAWTALMAPRNTPPDVVQRLNASLKKILSDEQVKNRLLGLGNQSIWMGPSASKQYIADDAAKWKAFIKRIDFKAN